MAAIPKLPVPRGTASISFHRGPPVRLLRVRVVGEATADSADGVSDPSTSDEVVDRSLSPLEQALTRRRSRFSPKVKAASLEKSLSSSGDRTGLGDAPFERPVGVDFGSAR